MKIKPLSKKGFSHVELILFVVVIVALASIGGYVFMHRGTVFAGSSANAAPAPGTSAQISKLVSEATSITSIPSNVTPTLTNALNDTPALNTPSLANCDGQDTIKKSCIYGDTSGKKTMVLWGDSHAFMWFPAVDAIATKYHWKLVFLYLYDCPVANISVWNPLLNEPFPSCNTYRKDIVSDINKLDPALVIMSEQFAPENSSQKTITPAAWTTALKSTLGSIKKNVKKAIIGDTINLVTPSANINTPPAYCLAEHPTNVQVCSVSENIPSYTAERKSEQTAASEESTKYINVIPWTCSSECTPIIGNMIVYYAQGHITATYDTYLTNVLYSSLKSLM